MPFFAEFQLHWGAITSISIYLPHVALFGCTIELTEMAQKTKNTEIDSWEEQARVLIAGKFKTRYSGDDSSSLHSLIKFWRILFILSILTLFYAIGSTVYETQTGQSLLGIFNSSEADIEAVAPFDVASLSSWKSFYGGYWGMAKWIAGSLVLAHFLVFRMIRSSFSGVSRTWRFMKSHAGDLSERALAVPESSMIEKEAMLSTSFRGFWREKTAGFPLSPFSLRLLLTLGFSGIYALLGYLQLVPTPFF